MGSPYPSCASVGCFVGATKRKNCLLGFPPGDIRHMMATDLEFQMPNPENLYFLFSLKIDADTPEQQHI